MEILAVDLIGPFEVEAVDGSKYLLMLRDAATGYCFVKPIKESQIQTRSLWTQLRVLNGSPPIKFYYCKATMVANSLTRHLANSLPPRV
jgi:hypothetical protein